MKTKLLLILLLLLPLNASAFDDYLLMQAMPKFPAGMTFLAIYNDGILDADRSGGVPTSTFSASRGANNPHTYPDANGDLQLVTTSNIGVFPYGFWDDTGFHLYTYRAIKTETASTNYLIGTLFSEGDTGGLDNDWGVTDNTANGITTTLVDVKSTFNVGTTVNAQRLVYTGVVADTNVSNQLGSTKTLNDTMAQNDVVVGSVWIKGTATGIDISLRISAFENNDSFLEGTNSSFVTLSSTEWRRFTFQKTFGNVLTKKANIAITINDIDDGDVLDIQITLAQLEKSPFATSFIPTTTAALTRNEESNKYETAGNRTKAVESMVMKFAPAYANSVTGIATYLLSSDTKNRLFRLIGDNKAEVKANATDETNSKVSDIINESWDANQEMTLGYNMQSGTSPFIAGFFNGVADGTNQTLTDFTPPAWGTFFWIGSNVGGEHLTGVILAIGFWDRILSDAEHLFLKEKDWRTLR